MSITKCMIFSAQCFPSCWLVLVSFPLSLSLYTGISNRWQIPRVIFSIRRMMPRKGSLPSRLRSMTCLKSASTTECQGVCTMHLTKEKWSSGLFFITACTNLYKKKNLGGGWWECKKFEISREVQTLLISL